MSYIIAIYANDYLTLLELMAKLEQELPIAEIKVFGSEELLGNLPVEAAEQVSTKIEQMKECDIVILLDNIPDRKAFLSSYYGKVIDLSESVIDDEDIIYVSDPLMDYLYETALLNEDMFITLALPMAAFGKSGIDTLMQETRSVFSFENFENSPLNMRIAFNVHQYDKNYPASLFVKELDRLRTLATVNIRLNPVSTVFIVDLFSKNEIDFPKFGMEFFKPEGDISTENITMDHKVAKKDFNSNVSVLMGDYLYVKINKVINTIKKLIEKLDD